MPRRGDILLVTSDGKGKRVASDQFPRQGRYGLGVIAWKLPRTAQLVGVAAGKANTRVTLLLDKLAPKAMRLDEAPLQARTASGKTVVDLKAGYQVLGMSIAWAVPRAVAGEKALPEKELEVPEEPAEPEAPEVEQLTFGLNESPTTSTPKVEKSKSHRVDVKMGRKARPAASKAKAVVEEQAPLIPTRGPTIEKATSAKVNRTRSTKESTPGKKKTVSASKTRTAGKKAAISEKKPSAKPGKREITLEISRREDEKPAGRTVKPKLSAKSSKGKMRKPAGRTGKPKSSPKSSKGKAREATGRTGKPQSAAKPAVSKGRIPRSNARKTKPVSKTKARKKVAKPLAKTAGKRKTATKKLTVKPAFTQLPVILPPSWRPAHTPPSSTKRKNK
jgi:DNA gyrase/topoisomerase IV subunit A